MRFRIQHQSGSKAGQTEYVDGRVIRIGRDPTSDLAFDPYADDKVSLNHAQIMVMDNGQILLSDLGSSNGTFLGEEKVTSAVPLFTGANVTVGEGGPQVTIYFATRAKVRKVHSSRRLFARSLCAKPSFVASRRRNSHRG